ncbi:MAG: hypothetical protein GX318_02695 [Clostridia bacterium]|nr:hypothetical protein [Clostridia bacterium]
MSSISTTEFDNMCKIAVPEIEGKLKERLPSVKSVSRFFQLEGALRLNLRVEYEKDGEIKVLTLGVPAQQVMDDNLEPVLDAITNAIS